MINSHFNKLNSTIADWQNDILKQIPIDYLSTHKCLESKIIDVFLSEIKGCVHTNYGNLTWLDALENLERFSFSKDTIDIIKNSVIEVHLFNNEAYMANHHRPIIARFLGFETIKVNLSIYELI